MTTGRTGSMALLSRFVAVAAALTLLAGSGQAMAQVVLRIEPSPVEFPAAGGLTSFDIFADNLTSNLNSFNLVLNERDSIFGAECLSLVSVAVDPALAATWASTNSNRSVSSNILTWTASNTAPSGGGLSGNIRLGTITYRATISADCPAGRQSTFTWEPDTSWDPSNNAVPGRPFDESRNAFWVIGPPPDVDLTITCTRGVDPGDLLGPMDPNDPNSTPYVTPDQFVDGQTLVVNCTLTNLGTQSSPTLTDPQPQVRMVFSVDQVIQETDTLIAARSLVTLGGGLSRDITLTGTPLSPLPGPIRICTKVDVNPTSGSIGNQPGLVLETDESNNVSCFSIEVLTSRRDLILVPNSISLQKSELDPNVFRAGLLLNADFDIQNQGIGAVRSSYWNEVLVGTTAQAALANRNASRICSTQRVFPQGQFQKGRAILHSSFGFDTFPLDTRLPSANLLCQIPFTLAPGTYALVVNTDSQGNVSETTPAGASAEGNNFLEQSITVAAPLPPEVRIRNADLGVNDLFVRIFDDDAKTRNPRSVGLTMISAQDVAAYSFTMAWAPADLAFVASAGDVIFTAFLEQNGRVQSCQVDALDNSAGTISGSCTSVPDADPNTSSVGATTQGSTIFAIIPLSALAPGTGTLTIMAATATNSLGADIPNLKITNGTFLVDGVPRVRVTNAVPPPVVYPGGEFATSYDLQNFGFGSRATPIQSRLVISQDGITDPDTVAPDVIACGFSETSSLPGLTTRSKSVSCNLQTDLVPGLYTGFYQVTPFDANTQALQDVVSFPINSRVASLRKSGKGQKLEMYAEPDGMGGTTGSMLSSARNFGANSLGSIKSTARNLNWLVRLNKGNKGRKLIVTSYPKLVDERLRTLTRVRLPGEDKNLLGAADIDGDGEDEIMLLQQRKGAGSQIDFRRIDTVERRPIICQSAAETAPGFFAGEILAAEGINYDGDPSNGDELAVLTDDGVLHIYDLALQGSLPPAAPCKPVPTVLEQPADAILVESATDPSFGVGMAILDICTLDSLLDGVEELGVLVDTGSGVQALRIFDPPAVIGGSATLLADDPDFGGSLGRAKALAITCTR